MWRVFFIMIALVFSTLSSAKEVEISKVELEPTGATWTVHVTLRHDDEGLSTLCEWLAYCRCQE